MKEHIKLILISIPLTFGLLELHGILFSQGWAMFIISELEIQNKKLFQTIFFLEYIVTSIFVAMPYALVITWAVKIKAKLLSSLSVLYFFSIYSLGFLIQRFSINNSIEGLFNIIIFIVCLALLLTIFITAQLKQRNI